MCGILDCIVVITFLLAVFMPQGSQAKSVFQFCFDFGTGGQSQCLMHILQVFATKCILFWGLSRQGLICSLSLPGTCSDPFTAAFQPGLEGVVTAVHKPTSPFLKI